MTNEQHIGELRELTLPLPFATVAIQHPDAGWVWHYPGDVLIILSCEDDIFRVLTRKGLYFLSAEIVLDETERLR